MYMTKHVRRGKEARLLHQKPAPWGTDTRCVMVMVVVVMVGYPTHGDRRKKEGRGQDRDEQGLNSP